MCAASTRLLAALVVIGLTAACGGDDDDSGSDSSSDGGPDATVDGSWTIEQQDLPGALLSVWGSTSGGMWAAGSRTDSGPLILHSDGAGWATEDTSALGEVDLWWVFGFDDGPVYFGGSGGTIASYQDGVLTPMKTPSTGVTVFGIWGCSPDDVWAVGGREGGSGGGFAWRLDGDAWVEAPGLPAEVPANNALWKVYGRGCDDVWMVGTSGVALHWDGTALGGLERVAGGSLFTVHANAERFVAVGGSLTGIVVENDGSGWRNVNPSSDPLFGVCLTETGGFASGLFGSILVRGEDGWAPEPTGIPLDQTLHSVWIDPEGDVWAAGGQIVSAPYGDGILLRRASR